MRRQQLQRPLIKAQCVHLDKRTSMSSFPKPRFKHFSFFFKNSIYIIGGTSIPAAESLEPSLDLHHYSLSSSQWQKTKLKCNNKDFQTFSGQCGCLVDHVLYIFGGTNSQFRSNNFLWRVNLDNHQVIKIDATGEIPASRESAAMQAIDNQWLALFGGVNTNKVEIYNSFHFYNIGSRTWYKCSGAYLSQLQPRYDPALCSFQDTIYLFGGSYRNSNQQELYLNDFYSIAASPSPRPQITVTRLHSSSVPEARAGHCLVSIGKGFLLLLGGEKSYMQVKDILRNQTIDLVTSTWVYSIQGKNWIQIAIGNQFKYRTQFTCVSDHNKGKAYIFGGLYSYSTPFNDLIQLTLPLQQLSKALPEPSPCQLCPLKSYKPSSISPSLIESLSQSIQFPFSAAALLIDNAMTHFATIINISFYKERLSRQSSMERKILRIQDNSKLPWNDQDFIKAMAGFNNDIAQIPNGIDKKNKNIIVKEHQRRQYGTNVKIASLRLGTGFLHLSQSENGQLIRVCLFEKTGKPKAYYSLKFYIIHKESGQVTSHQMKQTKKQIQQSYGSLIRSALLHQLVRNIIFILGPKIKDINSSSDEQFELAASERINDIICGNVAHYTTLQDAGYNIADSVDISFRAYLVSLYLKNDHTKITLSVKGGEPTFVSTQVYLERVDKLCRQKQVLEINNLLDFDFKIVQLYYLYDIRKKVNYFSNGLLIYHKNRLITRYKYQLGELIVRKYYKHQLGNYNFIRLFGFIQLSDHVPVNAFKTGVLYPVMLERLFSRLKCIDKTFKKELQRLSAQTPKRIAPTKQSHTQIRQDQLENNSEYRQHLESNKPTRRRRRTHTQKDANPVKSAQEDEVKDKEEVRQKPENDIMEDQNKNGTHEIHPEAATQKRASLEYKPASDVQMEPQKPLKVQGENEDNHILQEEQNECQIKVYLPTIAQPKIKRDKSGDHLSESEWEPVSNMQSQERKKKCKNPLRDIRGQGQASQQDKIFYPIKIIRAKSGEHKVEPKAVVEPQQNSIQAENGHEEQAQSQPMEQDNGMKPEKLKEEEDN